MGITFLKLNWIRLDHSIQDSVICNRGGKHSYKTPKPVTKRYLGFNSFELMRVTRPKEKLGKPIEEEQVPSQKLEERIMSMLHLSL